VSSKLYPYIIDNYCKYSIISESITTSHNYTRLMVIFQASPESRHQNVSILDLIGAMDDGDGGDN